MEATSSGSRQVMSILFTYERASGQMINRGESTLVFSPNVVSLVKDEISSIFSITVKNFHEKY